MEQADTREDHVAGPSLLLQGIQRSLPRPGRAWQCQGSRGGAGAALKRSRNEREGKLAGRQAAGASIIGPARNASSPQKEILRLRRDNKGLRFISNAEPAPRRPARRGQPTKDPFVHAGAGPAGSWDQGLTGGDRAQGVEGLRGEPVMESWGAEGVMEEEQRQVVEIEDHETENLKGGSEKGGTWRGQGKGSRLE